MTCPICRKPTARGYRPFCSRRCADIDLGNWFTESYHVPSHDPEDAAEVDESDTKNQP